MESQPSGITAEWKMKIGSFFVQSKRVWHLLKKPSSEEFKTIAKISAIGMLAIGAVGFIVADVIKIFV